MSYGEDLARYYEQEKARRGRLRLRPREAGWSKYWRKRMARLKAKPAGEGE